MNNYVTTSPGLAPTSNPAWSPRYSSGVLKFWMKQLHGRFLAYIP